MPPRKSARLQQGSGIVAPPAPGGTETDVKPHVLVIAEPSTPLAEAPKRRRAPKGKAAAVKVEVDGDERNAKEATDEASPPPRKRARVKKELKTEEYAGIAAPLRLGKGSRHYLGAHVSSAGGPENALDNAAAMGAAAVALFIRPKMNWTAKPLSDLSIALFPKLAEIYGLSRHVMPHGMYLTNLASPDIAAREKSLEAFVDELVRCDVLGILFYNFHPGSALKDGISKEEACKNVADSINAGHQRSTKVTVLIENMAGQGSCVGSTFEELRWIIDGVTDKTRVGICFDTCHAFAAGYDLRTRQAYEATMQTLDDVVGLQYLKGAHLNDSLQPFHSFRDRHANIGAGQIGLAAFYFIMNDPRFENMPLVLETPGGEDDVMYKVWKLEIEALYMLQSAPEDAEQWTAVRGKLAEAAAIKSSSKKGQKKEEKDAAKKALKAAAKAKAKGAKLKGKKRGQSDESAAEEDTSQNSSEGDE